MSRFARVLPLALTAALLGACAAPASTDAPGAAQAQPVSLSATVKLAGAPVANASVRAIDAVTFAELAPLPAVTDAQGAVTLVIQAPEPGHSIRLVARTADGKTLAAWLPGAVAEAVAIDERTTAVGLAIAPAAALALGQRSDIAEAQLAVLARPTAATKALGDSVAADPAGTAIFLKALDPETGVLPLDPAVRQAQNAYELGHQLFELNQSLELDYLGAVDQVLLKREANPSRSGPLDLGAEFNAGEQADLDALLGGDAAAYRLAGTSVVNPLAGINVQGMDLETAMMAVQADRANLLEQQLKDQVASVQARNDQIAKLNTLLAALQGLLASLDGAEKSSRTLASFSDAQKAQVKSLTDAVGVTLQATDKVSDLVTQLKGRLDELSSSQQMDMLRLQSLSNKRNEAFDVMTNFIKKMQDSRSSIVGNMRYRLADVSLDAAVAQLTAQRENASGVLLDAVKATLAKPASYRLRQVPPQLAVPGLNPGLYVQVLDGMVNVTNSAGALSFQAGQFGFVPGFQQPPVVLPNNPGLNFNPPPSFPSAGAAIVPVPGTSQVVTKSALEQCVIDTVSGQQVCRPLTKGDAMKTDAP